MILTVFIVFLIICFLLIFIGFYSDIRATAIVGFAGLFLLGMVLATGNVSVEDGFLEINHLACGECNGSRLPIYANFTTEYDNWTTQEYNITDNRSNTTWYNVSVNVPYNITTTEFIGYENIEGNGSISYIASTDRIITYRQLKDSTSKWFGIWLSIIGALGVTLILVNNRVQK